MSHLMKISEAASLALHAMSLLARYPDRRFSNVEMAKLFKASEHSLAKVTQRLVRANLIDSMRGPSGGFVIARQARDISILEIYEAVDGPIGKPGCLLGKGSCEHVSCILGGLACQVTSLVRERFQTTTLLELSDSMKLGDGLNAQKKHS